VENDSLGLADGLSWQYLGCEATYVCTFSSRFLLKLKSLLCCGTFKKQTSSLHLNAMKTRHTVTQNPKECLIEITDQKSLLLTFLWLWVYSSDRNMVSASFLRAALFWFKNRYSC